MVDPVYEPIVSNTDPRINDGCYYGGGVATGEEPCVPLTATTSIDQIAEANELAKQASVVEQLKELAAEDSEVILIASGAEVMVGQIVMFVDRSYRWVDDTQLAALGVLMGTSSLTNVGENESETVLDRLVALANNFVDGVLSIFTLKVDRVEVKDELCIDGVCVTADDLRTLLETQAAAVSSNEAMPKDIESNQTNRTEFSSNASNSDVETVTEVDSDNTLTTTGTTTIEGGGGTGVATEDVVDTGTLVEEVLVDDELVVEEESVLQDPEPEPPSPTSTPQPATPPPIQEPST